ncbi:23S rRNA (uracil(747)-C(5))-methyltransferase [Cellulomonas hominis]|uniref:23S rRNA (Uracil(747)-C(5))-methyltransferase n=1 Tax=Cellulomonas hominis TaxID=156981 RepID=A0A511FGL8_9CELL|nr:23S rRNA (uracil(747)-C(5))-methyltransferase RlmC [Cellulomonas hominis]MBB5472548.1 23S rRNA (uracil747-C5)-methyltransferase [Cellulomonas hominis]GEL48405.1 23S rRNA (uracil(747)-C(5))-methyltransferase [Cellulomonas hominis]
MQCPHYDAARCRSCTLIEQPYAAQLEAKQERCRELLAPFGPVDWLDPVASAESGFRNKAKMAVGGTVDAPTLGILDPGGAGVDLRDCGLYPASLQAALPTVAELVTRARLVPYDVPTRRGELKYVLVTQSPDGELMIRFVLRSTEALPRLRKHLPWLLAALPRAAVVSANLLPEHKAALEGDEEVVLTERSTLRMRVNDVDLHLRPQSFFQTNTEVAAALYRIGRDWVDAADPASVWDLYCGVGGFALHVARPGRAVVGIETSAEAVASAEQSRDERGLPDVRFAAGDATAFALAAGRAPDLVVVNPPRRGIGPALAGWLEDSGVRDVVYSSCNAASLARDLAAMPSLRPRRGRVLDMFPQTGHYEVVVGLSRG